MRFEKYQDRGGTWRWRIVAANNRTVADSGEGYDSESNVDRAIRMIKGFSKGLGSAPVTTSNGSRRREASLEVARNGQMILMVVQEGQGWNGKH